MKKQVLLDILNKIAPFELAEDWDNCGMQVDLGKTEIGKVGFVYRRGVRFERYFAVLFKLVIAFYNADYIAQRFCTDNGRRAAAEINACDRSFCKTGARFYTPHEFRRVRDSGRYVGRGAEIAVSAFAFAVRYMDI